MFDTGEEGKITLREGGKGRPSLPEREKFVPERNNRIKEVSWKHEQIVDWMLANPDGKMYECAEFLGVTQSWLSSIVNSDAFKDYEAKRRMEHQQLLSRNIVDKVQNVALLGLDVLEERIERERDEIPLGIVKDSTDMALKALGLSSSPKKGDGGVNLNLNLVTPDALASARENMRKLQVVSVENEEEEKDKEEGDSVRALAPS